MVEKIITGYNKIKMGIINDLSGVSEDILYETTFYDLGYMQSQIGKIQKELKYITKEIEISLEIMDNSDAERKRRNSLLNERGKLIVNMVFLASNSFKNLEDCIRLADGYEFAFMKCIYGLIEYSKGNEEKAFDILEQYYVTYGNVENHFLVNKVFGLLLAKRKQYKKAISFLSYALQFVPDDIECLDELSNCYSFSGDNDKKMVVEEILSILS